MTGKENSNDKKLLYAFYVER